MAVSASQDKLVHQQFGGSGSGSQALCWGVLSSLHPEHEVQEAVQCGKLHPTGKGQPGATVAQGGH